MIGTAVILICVITGVLTLLSMDDNDIPGHDEASKIFKERSYD